MDRNNIYALTMCIGTVMAALISPAADIPSVLIGADML